MEIFIIIREDNRQYYLLKVVRREFDVYCIPPHLGMHYTLHESGKAHFQPEERTKKPRRELPVVLLMGEAGKPISTGIICAPLADLGCASGICTAIFLIDSLSQDFQEFNRNPSECFVIDKDMFPKNTSGIVVGVWAVPNRNQVGFEFNNPGIDANLLYKVTSCEPQIWIYAQPV